jgi:hypothetical protein
LAWVSTHGDWSTSQDHGRTTVALKRGDKRGRGWLAT